MYIYIYIYTYIYIYVVLILMGCWGHREEEGERDADDVHTFGLSYRSMGDVAFATKSIPKSKRCPSFLRLKPET